MICETCGLPAAPHQTEECFVELVRKKKLGDAMFDAAISLVTKLGEPLKIEDQAVRDAVIALDNTTWRYAV